MREEEPSWFARWEEDLPSPEELMPLTQTLITPDLALAFDIPSPDSAAAAGAGFLRHGIHTQLQHHHHHHVQQKEPAFPPSSQPSPTQSQGPSSQLQQHALAQSAAAAAADYDSSELGGAGSGGGGGAGSGGGDEQARTLKRPRLVWTPQLHKRFVDAVAHLGIKNAVPKTIMQLMSVEGLTRENVASHLQKYRLYLKRMQGLSGGPGGAVGQIPHADQATEQLFASGPVPHPLLHHRGPTPGGPVGGGGVGTPDQFFPFASMAPLHPHQPPSQHQQMVAAAAAAAAAANYQQQTHQHHQQYYQQHRQAQQQMLGSSPGNGYEHGFLSGRQQHHPAAALQRMMGPVGIGMGASTGFGSSSPFGEDLDSGAAAAAAGGGGPERRKELTLFPTNDG